MNNHNKNPLVSVIIPTFNRSWTIIEALQSVLAQNYKPLELIIVDDGSSDDTMEKLKPFMEQIIYLKQENKGVSAARNIGIKKSKGEFIAFLDSDDLWLPSKISCQINFFNSNPSAIICQTEEIWIRNGKKVNPMKKHKKKSGMIFEESLELCLVSPSSVMMKKTFFDVIGYFDEDFFACEDYDLWLRTAITHPIFLINKSYTIKKGGHKDQLSKKHSLDKYRIKSIQKLLKNHKLTNKQIKASKKVLKKKCQIYSQGCIKRGKIKQGEYYKNIGLSL